MNWIKSNFKLLAILLVSTVSMARVGAMFGLINILEYPLFQWAEVISLVAFAIIEVFFIEKAGRTLAELSQIKKRTKMQDFIFKFVAGGMLFIGLWLPIVGGVAWVLLTGLSWLNLLWTIPTLLIVPVSMSLLGMSNIILPDKPSKLDENKILTSLYLNGKTPVQIADLHKTTVQEVEEIENKAKERFS